MVTELSVCVRGGRGGPGLGGRRTGSSAHARSRRGLGPCPEPGGPRSPSRWTRTSVKVSGPPRRGCNARLFRDGERDVKPFRTPERTAQARELPPRPAAARPPGGMPIDLTPREAGPGPSGPGRVGPSPPRTSPTAPQNRLRVTSPPFPACAGLRPGPSAVRPDRSEPGSRPRGSRQTYGPTGSSGGGGGRLRPSSEHTAQQHPGPPATRRIYVTPLPRDFRARDCPAPS